MKMFRVVVNGSEYKVEIEEIAAEKSSQAAQRPAVPSTPPNNQQKPIIKPQQLKPSTTKVEPVVAGGNVIAPMPGTVLQVAVNIGDNVTKGQVLLVLEAMKMENEIMAPTDGVVQELNVSQGVSVNAGDVLVVLS
jgi:biotin carboxyl carrier protein